MSQENRRHIASGGYLLSVALSQSDSPLGLLSVRFVLGYDSLLAVRLAVVNICLQARRTQSKAAWVRNSEQHQEANRDVTQSLGHSQKATAP